MSSNQPHSEPEPSRTIVEGILNKVESALAAMVKQHAGYVLAILLRNYSYRRRDDAEQAINQAAYEIWMDLKRLDRKRRQTDESLGTLMLMIAQRRMIDYRRAGTRREVPALTDNDLRNLVLTNGNAADEPTPKIIRDLYSVIDELSPLEQVVINYELAGALIPLEELAREHKTSVGTLRVAKSRATKKIREALIAMGHFSDD